MNKNMPTVRHWFMRYLDEIEDGTNSDDRHLKKSRLERIKTVYDSCLPIWQQINHP